MRYCALICEPSELRANGANGECGTGSCQSVAGVGLCTYAQQEATNSAVVTLLRSNPTHYGDPKTGCEADEQAVSVTGLTGDFCSPKCSATGTCPSDLPDGVTAKPQCALKTTTGAKYCALLCTPSFLVNGAIGECGTGTCQAIQGVGICTYDA